MDSSLLSEGTLFMNNSVEVLLQELIVVCLVGTVLAFYRTWSLINHVHKTLSLAQPTQHPPILLSCYALDIILSSFIALPAVSFLQVSPPKPGTHFSSLPYVPHDCLSTHSVVIQRTLQVINKANRVTLHVVLLQVACDMNVSLFCNGVAHCVCCSVCVCVCVCVCVFLLPQNCDLPMCFVSVMAFYAFMFCNRYGIYRLKK